jgi:hypothetical protein
VPIETYEVSGQIRIQKGNKTHIHRFKKRDMEHEGPVDTPEFAGEILRDFNLELKEEKEQTSLDEHDQGKEEEEEEEEEKKKDTKKPPKR